MLSTVGTLLFMVLTGAIYHPSLLSTGPLIELIAGVFLMYLQSYYYQLCQQQFYQIYLAKYYTLQPKPVKTFHF